VVPDKKGGEPRRIKTDSEIGIIILTGNGEKAFASGADINELSGLNPVSGLDNSRNH
jgi:enoyl-CoA hydratase/carnithine racemase